MIATHNLNQVNMVINICEPNLCEIIVLCTRQVISSKASCVNGKKLYVVGYSSCSTIFKYNAMSVMVDET